MPEYSNLKLQMEALEATLDLHISQVAAATASVSLVRMDFKRIKDTLILLEKNWE